MNENEYGPLIPSLGPIKMPEPDQELPPFYTKPAAGGERPAQALPADDGEMVDLLAMIMRGQSKGQAANWRAVLKTQSPLNQDELASFILAEVQPRWNEMRNTLAAQSAKLDALRAELHALKNPPPYIPVLCKYCGNDTHHIGDVCFFCGNDEAAAVAAKEDKPNG